MEPVEVAKSLILGKFAKPLTDGLYSGVTVDKIERYLARDLRVVNREAQQRFVAIIGPGLGIDTTSTNVFGTLTPTIDDVLGYTLKAGFALQVGFNYGLVNGDWRKAKSLYSSELYALEKVVIEVEGKDASALDEARKAAKRLVDGLLSYVDDVYLEFSGHKSYYVGLWLPEPIKGIEGLRISLSELYRRIGLRLARSLGKDGMSLVDKQYINAVKLLRVPGYLHEETGKPAQYLDTDFKPAEFDLGIMDRAVLSRGFIISVASSMVIAMEDRKPRRKVRRVKVGKVEEWGMVIKYMLNEGIRINDGRVRFSYVLGNYCAARRMSLGQCRELHSRLVEGANARDYQRYLEYGYQHPEYLPWPFVFFKGSEWYSVPDVEVFRDVFEALRGRVTKHVEVKHAPRPEAGQPKPSEAESKVEAKPSEVKVQSSPEVEPKQGGVEVKTGVKPSEATEENQKAESKPTQKPTEGTGGPVVDVKGIAKRVVKWLSFLYDDDEKASRLEPVIEKMVNTIIERGVVREDVLLIESLKEAERLVGTGNVDKMLRDAVEEIEQLMGVMGLARSCCLTIEFIGKASGVSEAKANEAGAKLEPKVEASEPKIEANAQPGQKPEPQASEVKPSEVNELKTESGASEVGVEPKPEANAHSSEVEDKPNTEGHEVDVRGVVDRVKSWLVILFKYNSEVVNKLEPIIEQMVSFIVERGVVGKWELWDRFYNEVKKLNTDDADSLFLHTLDIIIMAMEGMGLLKVNKNILTVVGKTSEAKPSEANEAKTEGKLSGVNETKPEAKVEGKAQPEQELEPPVGSEVKVEGNVSEAKAGPKTEVEVPEPGPNQELHGTHASGGMNHDSPTQAKATINIGGFINYCGVPVEAIVIRQSIIHSEAVEAPVNIATVDRIARRLCNSEDCVVSARLAIAFVINVVGKGPVRVGWLEDAFKSRHPIHYEVLRREGINTWVILTQLKGLGIVVVGDIATPGGWHSKWFAGLVARLLEARGRVSLSELVKMVKESEPDLPNAFEGGITLGDHVALAVKYLEWRGAVKVEGEAVSLVK